MWKREVFKSLAQISHTKKVYVDESWFFVIVSKYDSSIVKEYVDVFLEIFNDFVVLIPFYVSPSDNYVPKESHLCYDSTVNKNFLKSNRIIAVDFDGTIVDHMYPLIGTIKEDVVSKMRVEKKRGTTIIIWTCRDGKYIDKMVEFLKDNQIPYDYVNENVPWVNFSSRKILADEYWDDRAVNIL